MTEKLHWLPLSARIQFKIIFLVYKAFLDWARSYLYKLIMGPLYAISDCPLCSLDHNDLLVPLSSTSILQQCAFASAGPLLWNCKNPRSNSLSLILLYSSPFCNLFLLGPITLGRGASD